MIVHNVYAHINNSVIENILVCENYETASHLARMIYGNNAIAVDVTQYPVYIGDSFNDGIFTRIDESGNEIEIVMLPSEKEEIMNLKVETEKNIEEMTRIELAMIEMYEKGLGV